MLITRKTYFLFLIMSLALIWLTPIRVIAIDQQSFGGNKASDYQPPTGNPQTGSPAVLQPTNKSVQPVAAPLNQQALLQSGALTVMTADDKGAVSTGEDTATQKKAKSALPIWITGGLLTLLAVVYILFKPDNPAKTAKSTVESEQVAEKVAAEKLVKSVKPKTPKKQVKKTSRKKRKSARR